jgi:hypothetical protein
MCISYIKIGAYTFVLDNIIIFNKNIIIFRSILLSKSVPTKEPSQMSNESLHNQKGKTKGILYNMSDEHFLTLHNYTLFVY